MMLVLEGLSCYSLSFNGLFESKRVRQTVNMLPHLEMSRVRLDDFLTVS